DFDAAIFDSPLNRFNDHVFCSSLNDERDRFSLFEDAEPFALQPGGLTRNRAGGRHDFFDRFRRFGIGRKTGLRVGRFLSDLRVSAPGDSNCNGENGYPRFHKTSVSASFAIQSYSLMSSLPDSQTARRSRPPPT